MCAHDSRHCHLIQAARLLPCIVPISGQISVHFLCTLFITTSQQAEAVYQRDTVRDTPCQTLCAIYCGDKSLYLHQYGLYMVVLRHTGLYFYTETHANVPVHAMKAYAAVKVHLR